MLLGRVSCALLPVNGRPTAQTSHRITAGPLLREPAVLERRRHKNNQIGPSTRARSGSSRMGDPFRHEYGPIVFESVEFS